MATMEDLKWAAGFLEGEGYFGWRKNLDKNSGRMYGGCALVAVQVQKWPLEELQKLIGGSITIEKRRNEKMERQIYSEHEWTTRPKSNAFSIQVYVT